MLKPTIATAALLIGLAIQSALAGDLRDDSFITALNGNTLTDKTPGSGTAFNVYFLPGGTASYQESNGRPHFGRWSLDKSGDVCLWWTPRSRLEDGCFKVAFKGNEVTFSSRERRHLADLAGTVESPR